jgi:glycerol-3-phosphate dehydrogenase
MQFLEVILIQVVEESARPDRMTSDVEIVNVSLPVLANLIGRRHGDTILLRVRRDLGQLTARTFDVLVVGGGIYGLTIACDAALRGLSVALIERGDFGSGSTFNHLRTIHGGLRYLQSLDLRRARESMHERRTLARLAPHGLEVMPFALALFRSLRMGKTVMRAGLMLDRLLSADRNRGVAPWLALPPGRVISRDEAVQRFPGLRRPGMTGAAVWHDYVTPESDRLTLAWGLAAAAHGAILANYVEATAPIADGARVTGVRALDRLGSGTLEIAARLTVNATGPAVDRLLDPLGLATGLPLVKAMNLVTRRTAGSEALGGRTPAGRHLFLVPWRSRALFGTWESKHRTSSDNLDARGDEIAAFIADLNHAFPSLDLTPADVSLVHRGVVPAVVSAEGAITLESRDRIVDHAPRYEGILSVAGVKYTTARLVAERATDRIVAKLGRPAAPCQTRGTALPGAGTGDVAWAVANARREHDSWAPRDTIPHLVAAYGTASGDVLNMAASHGAWRTKLADDSPVIGAELVLAVRQEMAMTLSDAVVRRTPLGALGDPGEPALERAAALVGSELGWDEARQRQEVAATRALYRIT